MAEKKTNNSLEGRVTKTSASADNDDVSSEREGKLSVKVQVKQTKALRQDNTEINICSPGSQPEDHASLEAPFTEMRSAHGNAWDYRDQPGEDSSVCDSRTENFTVTSEKPNNTANIPMCFQNGFRIDFEDHENSKKKDEASKDLSDESRGIHISPPGSQPEDHASLGKKKNEGFNYLREELIGNSSSSQQNLGKQEEKPFDEHGIRHQLKSPDGKKLKYPNIKAHNNRQILTNKKDQTLLIETKGLQYLDAPGILCSTFLLVLLYILMKLFSVDRLPKFWVNVDTKQLTDNNHYSYNATDETWPKKFVHCNKDFGKTILEVFKHFFLNTDNICRPQTNKVYSVPESGLNYFAQRSLNGPYYSLEEQMHIEWMRIRSLADLPLLRTDPLIPVARISREGLYYDKDSFALICHSCLCWTPVQNLRCTNGDFSDFHCFGCRHVAGSDCRNVPLLGSGRHVNQQVIGGAVGGYGLPTDFRISSTVNTWENLPADAAACAANSEQVGPSLETNGNQEAGAVNRRSSLRNAEPSQAVGTRRRFRKEFSTNNSLNDPRNMQRENLEMRRRLKCRMCNNDRVSGVFRQCGHLLFCYNCALTLYHGRVRCPICNGSITDVVRVNLA